jgi:hypothetical protein
MRTPAQDKLVRAVPLGLIAAASAATAPAGMSAPLATNLAALATPDQQAVEALAALPAGFKSVSTAERQVVRAVRAKDYAQCYAALAVARQRLADRR